MASSVNTALANLTETKIEIKTDANLCIPSEWTESIIYIAYGSNKNLPTNDTSYFIRTQRSTSYIVQFASNVQNALTKTEADYTRKAKLSEGTWTFSPWEKIATETDLTALSELQLAQFNDCNNIKPSAKQRVIFAETTYLAANAPTGSNYWAIKAFILGNTPAYVTQIAVSIDGSLRKTRYYNGSTWSSWA